MNHAVTDHGGSAPAPQQELDSGPRPEPDGAAPGKALTEAARRALAEAADRRVERDRRDAAVASRPELNGRGGLDPVRYEDWEIAGRAVDF